MSNTIQNFTDLLKLVAEWPESALVKPIQRMAFYDGIKKIKSLNNNLNEFLIFFKQYYVFSDVSKMFETSGLEYVDAHPQVVKRTYTYTVVGSPKFSMTVYYNHPLDNNQIEKVSSSDCYLLCVNDLVRTFYDLDMAEQIADELEESLKKEQEEQNKKMYLDLE